MKFLSFLKDWLSPGHAPLSPPPRVGRSLATIKPLLGHPRLNDSGHWKREDPKGPPRLVIFSGAGLSHESGLSLFRGSNGLWDNYKIEEVCNGNSWRNFRDQVNAFYEKRSQDNLAAQPHAGHAWCAEMEREGAVLLSQNVDTLLERSGATHVGHLHGRLDHHRCFECDFRWVREVGESREKMVQCPACQGVDTRIDVVFFHERAEAYESARNVLGGLRDQDVLLVVGTTTSVVNPLFFLTANPAVWVVDPEPPDFLECYPGIRIWRAPASQIGTLAGPAWRAHQEKFAGK